jgi:26S proteasome regulatory subunit N6
MQAKYKLAEDKFKDDKEAGLNDFLSIVHDQASNTEDDIKVKEAAIYQIIDYFSSIKDVKRLCSLLKEIRPLLSHCPQAKTAKIIKSAFDALIKIPGSLDDGLEICKDIIQWCVDEKRSFLKLRMEIRLANLYYLKQLHKEALNLITNLKIDIKKIEDVMLHIDINLIETKIHIEVENIPRAKVIELFRHHSLQLKHQQLL